MNRITLAKELLRLARSLSAAPKTVADLSPSEQKVAEKMKEKGYKYAVQITTVDGNFGEPLYFKSSGDVGPFLRTFPDYKNAKMAWTITL